MDIEYHQQLASDFCPCCGALVDLDTLSNDILCFTCKKKLSFTNFIGKPIKTTLSIQGKEWVSKYHQQQKILQHPLPPRQKKGKSKMLIKQKCPKCQHPQLKYYVQQTRSADEGSTVFYECQACHYNFAVNN